MAPPSHVCRVCIGIFPASVFDCLDSLVCRFCTERMALMNEISQEREERNKLEDKVMRGSVLEELVEWSKTFNEYSPIAYTSPSILSSPSYADPDISDPKFSPKWNAIDGYINRKSHETIYEIDSGAPRNHKGRTGIIGRGCLGRWGPNHAADPIVTRWKLDGKEFVKDENSGKRILQFVSIQRRDCGEWAIPGGMVDAGEKVTSAVKREFMEEALSSHGMSESEKKKAEKELEQLFKNGTEVFSGYVDDPRNTDNAWMETVAFNFHEDDPSGILYSIKLNAGDDAVAVTWKNISRDLKLYASHISFLEKVVERLKAHW